MFYSFSQPGFPLAPLEACWQAPRAMWLVLGARWQPQCWDLTGLSIHQQWITLCYSSVFQGVSDMVTFIKTAFSSRIFTEFCKWNGGGLMWPQKALVPHRGFWIAHGKVLKRILGLKDELYIFLWQRKKNLIVLNLPTIPVISSLVVFC